MSIFGKGREKGRKRGIKGFDKDISILLDIITMQHEAILCTMAEHLKLHHREKGGVGGNE